MIGSLPHTCTIQRRYQKQTISYGNGTTAFNVGAVVTGGVSGATAVIDKKTGTTATGTLVLKTVVGVFQNGQSLVDNGTSPGSATATTAPANYRNDSNEAEYYWKTDQSSVPCRFYSVRSRVTVLTPGQFPGLAPFVILPSTVTIDPLNYRIQSAIPGYTPASGLYGILGIKAPYNRMVVDHYTVDLKELASA